MEDGTVPEKKVKEKKKRPKGGAKPIKENESQRRGNATAGQPKIL